MNQTTQPNIVNIQDDTYYFTVYLVNSDNRVLMLRPDGIKQLIITDTFTDYYQGGYIILDNKFDALEQPSQVVDKNSDLNTSGYIFKGNARDVLRVEIMPKLNYTPMGSDSDDTTNSFFRLSYEFIIYDIEEILGDNPGEKYKKLHFHDIYHELLSEKNLQFSTAEMVTDTKDLSNESRSQYTGDAIKYIINKALNTEDSLSVAFDGFNQGTTKIFFSAPTNFKAIDCINYLLERHVDSKDNDYDQCFLRLNRFPKTWALVSLADVFKLAYNTDTETGGELFLEKFMLGGFAGSSNNLQNYAVTIERSPKLSLYLPKYGTLDNFAFIPAAGVEQQLTATNRNVYSYNFSEGSFNIDSNQNDFSQVKKTFFQNYVKPMRGQKNQPVTSLVDNKYRTLRQNVESIYSTSEESAIQRLSVGRNIALTNSVFLNSCISFRVKGATYRQAGYFIAIDRNNAVTDCDFDNKLLGIYFIVDVKHIFAQNTYYNDLLCIKTYLYKDINSLPSPV